MTLDATTLPTPVGDLALIARDDTLVAAGFTPLTTLAARLPAEDLVVHERLGRISDAVAAYVDGDLHAIDNLPVDQPGGDFAQAAWKAMRDVPAGQVVTYGELAERAGRPLAVRAAGTACGRNLIAPIVPCHRIVRTDHGLGGYYYGLPVKQWLLAHEGVTQW